HPVHPPGEIEDEGAADGLAGERGPPAPREEGHALRPRDLDSRLDIVSIAGDDDADRLHLVHGRVGGVEKTRGRIEANVPGDDLAKFVLELAHARYYNLRGCPNPPGPPVPASASARLRRAARRRARGARLHGAPPRQPARIRLARVDRQERPRRPRGEPAPGRDRAGEARARTAVTRRRL